MSIGEGSPEHAHRPLVSVGIPTFNRPEGLRRTLCQILAQTHRNLEVIVSDNASTNPEVELVGMEFAAKDGRVRYIRQPANIGAMPNFKYVLQSATGDYFMWAADDDEWSPLFIEKCLSASAQGETVACKFDTLFRVADRRESNPVPTLNPACSALANVKEFLQCMQPSLIYGLHKRASLEYFNKLPTFDFVDCYFVFRQILGPGVKTIPDVLYTAGVDAVSYEIKYVDAHAKKFDYAPFYLRTAALMLLTRSLPLRERLEALKAFNQTIYGLIRHHENCGDPRPLLVRQVWRFWRRALVPRWFMSL
ncbi:glycosyltransferase family 2 protein [Cupriavidus oxalaticus]|uniref:glycosyltransferase family 2 protein n=1 Tax=Cupriavidus oxalaticus TaxID=96344 RepID=UPI00316C6E16